MSYRELRNFTEMMRALGYSRLISMENFRQPNFPLVAEILIWLVKRFEPDADIHTEFTTEEDRVMLVRSAAQFMAMNANIKLNTKRVYQADGYAVKELLKVTSLLYDALRVDRNSLNQHDTVTSSTSLDISSRIAELKMTRELASQITAKGAVLYELLGKEVKLREARNSCVNNQLELNNVEEGLKDAISAAKDSVANTKSMIENVAVTETTLDNKIEKRQAELERNSKRLQTLRKVRPAFLEEFERLEVELSRLYQDYITRFRCVAFLEQQLEDAELAEQERMEERQAAVRKVLEKMQQEESLKLLDDTIDVFQQPELETQKPPATESNIKQTNVNKISRIRTGTGAAGRRRVYGGMTGGDEDEDSLESDSDLLLDDDDDDDNSQLLASDDDLELLDTTATKQSDHSDDDF